MMGGRGLEVVNRRGNKVHWEKGSKRLHRFLSVP